MELYQHQAKLVDLNPSRHLVCFGTGCGKTLTAIELANKNRVDVLIICPKGLKENWRRNCVEHLHMPYQIVSKEEFRRDWESLAGFQAIIVDEAHAFGNLKSQMSKALLKYCRKHVVTYRWLLTATPFLSSPMNIYALATHLGYEWNYWKFYHTFFTQINMGGRLIPKARAGMQGELARLVKTIGTTAKLEDLVDVPEQMFETEYFDLTREQSRAIATLDETNFIARWTKSHEIEQGYLKGNEYEEPRTFPSNKLDRLHELAEENDKIAIFARYNGQLETIKTALGDLGKPIFIINGANKDRDTTVREAEDSEQAIVLIQADTAEGYELPSIGVIVFASLSFSYKNYVQGIGRFLRINRLKPNYYLHMIVRDGNDEMVWDAIKRKEDFHLEIYSQ